MKSYVNFPMQGNDKLREELEEHALSSPDREVCGFVYENFYLPLRNIAADDNTFYADPAEIAHALVRYGEPLAIFHTHPNGCRIPSSADMASYYKYSTIIIGTLADHRLHLSYF